MSLWGLEPVLCVNFFVKLTIFLISMPLCGGIATLPGLGDQVGAAWAKQKSNTKSVGMEKNGFDGPSRSKVWTVGARCSVEVMEIARESPRRRPDLSRIGGQSLSKRQVI